MRRSPAATWFLALGVVVALSAGALAAKVKNPPPPPPPPPPPAWSWTGFYAGGNVGYGWGSSPFNETIFNSITGLPLFFGSTTLNNIDGVIGGGQIGFNWQYGNWVAGLEADIQASSQQGSATLICPAGICSITPVTTNVTEKLDWFGTVRPRLGWTVTPTAMIYATGGLAYGKLTDSGTLTNGAAVGAFNINNTSAGWTVGGGIEGQLVGNWTWRLEYLFLELKEPSGSFATPIPVFCPPQLACPGQNNNGHIDPLFTDNILRGGFNYKWP